MDIYYGDLKISDSKSFTDRVLEILKEEYNMDINSFGIRNPENFVLPVFESNGEVVKHRIEDGVYKCDYVDISGREEFKNFEAVDITEYLPEELRHETAKNGYVTFYPNVDGIDGFFIAKMKRCKWW